MKIVFKLERKGSVGPRERVYYLDDGGEETEIGRIFNAEDAPEGMAEFSVAQNNFEAGMKAMAQALGHGDLEIEKIEE